MPDDILTEALRGDLDRMVEQLTERIASHIPRYANLPREQVRTNARLIIAAILDEDEEALAALLSTVSEARLGQRVGLTEFLTAIHQGFPVFREAMERHRATREEHIALEARLHRTAVVAAEAFSTTMQRSIEHKNRELNRLSQLLREDVQRTSAALGAATELHERVVESLTSGLLVVDRATQQVTLYTGRMEEITELPTERVLNRQVGEAFGGIEGLDVPEMLAAVEREGRLPLRKMRVGFPSGRSKSVLVRGERLMGAEGDPEGTVVVVDDVSERELLIDSFSRYVSSDLVKKVLAKGETPILEGERQVCTAMFADIRGFTALAEGLTAEALHEVLNAYFRVMIAVIHRSGGFIDKFVGDMIMSLFVGPDHGAAARSALGAAAGIKRETRALSRERIAGGLPPIEVGIGVNTGEALIGNIGSELRMDFTAIGDTVNVAARLQSLATRGEVLCGPETARLAAGLPLRHRGPHAVKNRDVPVDVWELLPTEGSEW